MSSPCVEVVGAQRRSAIFFAKVAPPISAVQIDARSERRAGIAGAVPADLMIAGIEPAGNQGAHEASVHGVDAERHRLGRGAGHAQPDHGGRIEGIRPVLPERGRASGAGSGAGTGGGSADVSTGNVATPVCQLSWWNMGQAIPAGEKVPG